MTQKSESRLVAKIVMGLEYEVGGWWVKIHGGPYQRAGLPDLIGCVKGLFFGLEVKLPREDYDALQLYEAEKIERLGHGIAACVHTPEEALTVVRQALSRAGKGCRVRLVSTRNRTVL